METIKKIFKRMFSAKDFREVKEIPQKKEPKKIKIFTKENVITTIAVVSSYFLGKFVMKKQFQNALLSCDFITPPEKGHSNICSIDCMDDIIENTVKLHKKGEILEV